MLKHAPSIGIAGRKMPPAAVIGNLQVGIGFARDLRDEGGDRREPAFVEREMRRASLGDPAMDHAAALAHGGGGIERGKLRRRRVPGFVPGEWSRPRPTVPAKSSRRPSPAK